MSKLQRFQANLDSSNLISSKDANSVKGGIRFVTESEQEFLQMQMKLEHYGISFTTHEGMKEYCIDW